MDKLDQILSKCDAVGATHYSIPNSSVICGSNSKSATTDKGAVTCKRCRHLMGWDVARKDAQYTHKVETNFGGLASEHGSRALAEKAVRRYVSQSNGKLTEKDFPISEIKRP
jgi:hypothetical protein